MRHYLIPLLIAITGSLSTQAQMLAGTAKINITPATVEPIHDSVFARALVLESRGVKIAIVSVDLAVF
ncbi:MAG TPA: hypothetical protein VKQ52_19220, partial [Puia sp.]|nr:hypothetical protein [Puia sp.]